MVAYGDLKVAARQYGRGPRAGQKTRSSPDRTAKQLAPLHACPQLSLPPPRSPLARTGTRRPRLSACKAIARARAQGLLLQGGGAARISCQRAREGHSQRSQPQKVVTGLLRLLRVGSSLASPPPPPDLHKKGQENSGEAPASAHSAPPGRSPPELRAGLQCLARADLPAPGFARSRHRLSRAHEQSERVRDELGLRSPLASPAWLPQPPGGR